MIIAAALDRNYMEFAAVMLSSLASNGEVADAKIVICSDGLTNADKDELIEAAKGMHVNFIDLAGAVRDKVASLKSTTNWPTTVYACILLPELVPDTAERLLILDCDILIKSSLRELASLPLDTAFGAVPVDKDPEFVAEINARIGSPSDARYFNSGVLLIDIPKWRNLNITEKALMWASDNPDRISYPDQDALNAACRGEFTILEKKWNCYGKQWNTEDAAVLHFVYDKPNTDDSRHPCRGLWLEHRNQTKWANKPLQSKLDRRIRKLRKKIMSILT
ncbi:glycosyltransferase family 8 protein [Sphingobium phenoxybenzoativorans]|uniref:Glycosyltransferase family 8 protein n=1 Tax=Sphingobium phenoxybenzoativorans TaxID=1592790 RepID=A0A975K6F2_9SPHN|nr:glycosyltransferase family 8 protein [Sphingobium phenoxybenzoativorans]QUT05661.1 glycosyltransferase family 8 protein [Sphingobium phenoxybenzoativorans]